MEEVEQGIEALNGMAVTIERMKHQTTYFEQELNRLDAEAAKSPLKRFLERLLG